MNKGSKLIYQIMSAFEKDLSRRSETSSEAGQTSNSELVPACSPKTTQQQRRVVVQKKETNFVRRMCQLSPPLKMQPVFKLYGFLGIHERALENPDLNESHMYSYLESRVVQRIEFYEHAIVIQVTEPTIPLNQPSVEYIIEKYKSKGETKFYELAVLIQEICQLLKLSHQKLPPDEKNESVKKWLDILGDQMFVTSIGSRKFGISKSLLTYLQYDLEEFAIEAIKYRLHRFFSAVNYDKLVTHLLNCLKYIAKCSLGQISLSEFKQLTTYHFCDFIESKNNVRSFCDMTMSMLNPAYCCHKINFIYYKETEKKGKALANTNPERLLAIQNEKERIRQEEFVTIKKLKPVPRHLLKENQKLFASYKTIEDVDAQPLVQQLKN